MADNSDPKLQSQYAVASFTVGGNRIMFAILDDDLSGGNRLVQHKRPYRKGTKLDSTGAEPRQWKCNAIFNNSIQEPGLDEDILQYPDNMQDLLDQFDLQETGDLVTPTDGKMRARAFTYQRTQSNDEDDTARVALVFVEDNEDDVDASTFARPNVRGSLIRLAEQAQFTAQQDGVWSTNVADLREFCANIEGIINAPGETIDSVAVQVRAAQHAMRDVLRTAYNASSGAPTRTISAIKRMLDVSAWALEEHNQNPPRRQTDVIKSVTTLAAFAALVKQSPDDLLELNDSRIDDPFAIQPGEYRILQT